MLSIASSFNLKYLQHFLVMAKSVEVNTPHTYITFHVLHSELTKTDMTTIKNEFITNSYINIEFYKIDLSTLVSFNLNHDYLSYETLSRLILAEVLPLSVNRVIYIDSDIVVRKNLNDIYYTDLEDKLVGAVLDMNPFLTEKFRKQIPRIQYFNAGVLLIELNKWRDLGLTEKFISFALSNVEQLEHADQDVLNVVLANRCKLVDLEWNVNKNFYDFTDFTTIEYEKEKFERAISDPAIIHFTGRSKPWFYLDSHPFKGEYLKYLNLLTLPKQIYKEKQYIEDKKVIVFGTGEKAKSDLKIFENYNITIKCLFDNNRERWGQTLNGFKITEPTLDEYDISSDIIVISSQYYEEIGRQLKQLGLNKGEHYFEDLSYIGAIFN